MVLHDENMPTRNARWRLVVIFLLMVLGALGLGSGHLGEGLADHADYVDLPCSGSAALPFSEGSICLGLWEYPLALTWMDHATVTGNAMPEADTFEISVVDTLTPCDGLSTRFDLTIAYIEQSPRLLENMALLSLFCLLLFVSTATSTFARRKRLTSVQRRKVLAKRQRSRLLAILITTTSATCRRRLSVEIARLSHVIALIRAMIFLNKPRTWLRRAPARRSLDREGANALPNGVFMNLWTCCWSALRRAFGTSDMIAGLLATIERQSATIDDTAADLQLAHREAATATGEATAARAERDAAVRDRILAQGKVEKLQAALAEQASVAAATAGASAVVASSELAVADGKAHLATSLATEAVLERHAENVERDQAAAAAVEIGVQLSETRAAAATAANDLAATTAVVVALEEKLEKETAATTTAINELVAARKETALAISASNEAKESRRLADIKRDGEVAVSAGLRAELLVQTKAVAATTEKLAIATQAVARDTSESKEAAEECRLAESGRIVAVGAVAKLQVALARKTTEAITANEGWAASQREADSAISEATNAKEGRRLTEKKLATAITSVVQLRAALAEKTSEATTATTELTASQRQTTRAIAEVTVAKKGLRSAEHELAASTTSTVQLRAALEQRTNTATTATTECKTVRQEALLATLAANAADERRQLAEVERDRAVAAAFELEAALVAQTAATATATSEGETARQEVVRATLGAKTAALGRDVSERERKCAIAAVAELEAALQEKDIAATSTASQLEASRQDAARAFLSASEAAQDRDASEQERTRAVDAFAEMRSKLEQVTEALNSTANQLSAAVQDRDAWERERDVATAASVGMRSEFDQVTATLNETANQLAISQQETNRAVLEANAAMLERDRATLAWDSAKVSLVEMQAALDRAQRKRGTFALEEGSSATTVTNVNGVAGMETTTARKKARFAIFPGRNVNAAAAATTTGNVPIPPGSSFTFGPSNASGNVGQSAPRAVFSPLIAFYRDGGRSSGSGTGGQGTSLGEFLLQSYEWLESTHDYIQWVFPTQQASRTVRNAPVLTLDDLEEVARHGEHVRGNMVLALEKMLSFYGLGMLQRGGEVCIFKGEHFNPEARWMKPHDHNALRLTRMITSLRLFKLEQYANALQAFLCGLPELRTHPSQEFWRSV